MRKRSHLHIYQVKATYLVICIETRFCFIAGSLIHINIYMVLQGKKRASIEMVLVFFIGAALKRTYPLKRILQCIWG